MASLVVIQAACFCGLLLPVVNAAGRHHTTDGINVRDMKMCVYARVLMCVQEDYVEAADDYGGDYGGDDGGDGDW